MCFSFKEQEAPERTPSKEPAAVEPHPSGKTLSQAQWQVGAQKVEKMALARRQGLARPAAGGRSGSN